MFPACGIRPTPRRTTAPGPMAADDGVATVAPTAAGQRWFEFPPCAVLTVNPLPLRLRPARMPGVAGSIALPRSLLASCNGPSDPLESKAAGRRLHDDCNASVG